MIFYHFSEKLYTLYQFYLHSGIGQPISKRYQKTAKQKFLKLYPGGFAEYTYPQFQNSHEFAMDGGVILTLWSIAESVM